MRFPLPHHPFQKVELTSAQCHDFEHVTNALLHETLEEYDRFVRIENRTLHRKLWKPVKTRENLTVYKETQRHGTASRALPKTISNDAAVSLAVNMNEWRLPKLLAVGSIAGTLDDVMYGVVAPDVKSMLLRSSYVGDELVDGGVLCHIQGATSQDPFRFLGVKWLVKAHPTAINAVVSPRDTVVVDATGLHIQENGDRIGYHVFHSVLLPECPELKHMSILRGYLSSIYLFKQVPNGAVEVYMKTYVDPGGRLTESLAIMSVANALIGCYKSVLCAQGKKLTWLIKRNAAERSTQKQNQRRNDSINDKDHCCELCQAAFRSYKVARGCTACLRSVCSRCHTTRKISHMQRVLQVKQTSVVVCHECLAQAGQLKAFDVARDEFVGRQVHQHSLMTDTHSSDGEQWTMPGTTLLSEEMMEKIGSSPTPSNALSVQRSRRAHSVEQNLHMGSWSTGSLQSSDTSSSLSSTSTGELKALTSHDQMMVQMNQLRLAAEETYMITKQNESAMRFVPIYD